MWVLPQEDVLRSVYYLRKNIQDRFHFWAKYGNCDSDWFQSSVEWWIKIWALQWCPRTLPLQIWWEIQPWVHFNNCEAWRRWNHGLGWVFICRCWWDKVWTVNYCQGIPENIRERITSQPTKVIFLERKAKKSFFDQIMPLPILQKPPKSSWRKSPWNLSSGLVWVPIWTP